MIKPDPYSSLHFTAESQEIANLTLDGTATGACAYIEAMQQLRKIKKLPEAKKDSA
jgi:hypothetical protein